MVTDSIKMFVLVYCKLINKYKINIFKNGKKEMRAEKT